MTSYIQDTLFPIDSGFDFKNVSWITLSPSENEIYILQRGFPCVTIWSLSGNYLSSWNTNELGNPHSLKFQLLENGEYRVWITDMAPPSMTGNLCGHCIKQFDMSGNYLGSIGTCGENTQGSGISPVQFDKVTDVSFDSNGNMWVTDGDLNGLNNRVLQIDISIQQVLQEWCAPGNVSGSGPKEFHLPHNIDIDDLDRVWIADALNSRIQVINTDGTFIQEIKCFGSYGVYGVRVRKDLTTNQRYLYVSTSPKTSPTGGTIKIFSIADEGLPVSNDCISDYQWNIELEQGTSTGMLHMIEATTNGNQIFLATLGGDLLPQKWIKVSLPN